MFGNKTLAKLFANRPASEVQNKLSLKVDLSFIANGQVSYKDENGYLKIKKFRSKLWETNFLKSESNYSPIELKVFVYSPNLVKDEELSLSISLDGELVEQKSFTVPMDKEHAGWFNLVYKPMDLV